MICTKKIGLKGTTLYGMSVYFLVTIMFSLWTPSSKAQLLNLSSVSSYEYQGKSEVLGHKPCIVKSTSLEKNFMGRLTQNIELMTLESDGRSVKRRHVLKLNPITRDKAPLTCNKKSKACLWEFIVSQLNVESSNKENAKEFYYLTLESYLKDPEKFYLVTLLKAGSATGARRIHWDCVISKIRKVSPLPPDTAFRRIPKAIPVAE